MNSIKYPRELVLLVGFLSGMTTVAVGGLFYDSSSESQLAKRSTISSEEVSLSSGKSSKSENPANALYESSKGGAPPHPSLNRDSDEQMAHSSVSPSPLPSIAVYTPPIEQAPAHPSNYGERYLVDASSKPVNNELLLVLHETGWTADSAINVFQANNVNDSDQVSYHHIIRRDGTVVEVVPLEKRAYGAGNSEFKTETGVEAVATNPGLPSSVNNFAYHVSFESPPNISWQASAHEGYTEAQYRSLAWLVARENIPDDRITTHAAVDRLGARMDPRNFSFDKLELQLANYPGRRRDTVASTKVSD